MRGLVCTLLVATLPTLAAPAPDSRPDAALETRVQAVAAELRCLVCQNQSLADSHAALALDLKNPVREQLQAGRSEADVVSYMTDRYGDFVRYRPPFKPSTWLLWGGPALLVLLLAWLLWRGRRGGALPRIAPQDRAHALRLLGEPQTPAPTSASPQSEGTL